MKVRVMIQPVIPSAPNSNVITIANLSGDFGVPKKKWAYIVRHSRQPKKEVRL